MPEYCDTQGVCVLDTAEVKNVSFSLPGSGVKYIVWIASHKGTRKQAGEIATDYREAHKQHCND